MQIRIIKIITAHLLISLITFSAQAISLANSQKDSRLEHNNQISKKISRLISDSFENDQFNGALLVASDGNIIFKNAYGYANWETKTNQRLNSIFSIASISKTFTSMAIMVLREQNKLEYDSKVDRYLPELPNAEKITIRHLLNHTSGMHSFMEYGGSVQSRGKTW